MNQWLFIGVFYAAGAAGFAVWWTLLNRKHPEINAELEADPLPTWISHAVFIVAWLPATIIDLTVGLPYQHRRR